MRTVLIMLSLWLLLNVLFVMAMVPPRKPRKKGAPGASEDKLSPAAIDIIISVGMGAFFVLVPPIAQALDAIKRFFRKKPPADGAGR
jgi:hypothetical protein